MGLLADLSIPAAELYLGRFCVTRSRAGVIVVHKSYRPLLEFAEVAWTIVGTKTVVADELEIVPVLTGEHVRLIEDNANGFGQLFEWFPPRTQPSGDETRLLVRAGVPLKFVVQKIGVYNRHVSKYNG